jgi:hypothetical protein
MNRLIHAGLAFIVISSGAFAAERSTRFWNLTRQTISEFYLAPAGSTNWGDNQCKNDKDGSVESRGLFEVASSALAPLEAEPSDLE